MENEIAREDDNLEQLKDGEDHTYIFSRIKFNSSNGKRSVSFPVNTAEDSSFGNTTLEEIHKVLEKVEAENHPHQSVPILACKDVLQLLLVRISNSLSFLQSLEVRLLQ